MNATFQKPASKTSKKRRRPRRPKMRNVVPTKFRSNGRNGRQHHPNKMSAAYTNYNIQHQKASSKQYPQSPSSSYPNNDYDNLIFQYLQQRPGQYYVKNGVKYAI